MSGERREIAKSVVNAILDTLGDNDFVNVYRFSDTTEELAPCFKDMLVQVMQHAIKGVLVNYPYSSPINQEPGWRNRYSAWLRAGRVRGQSLSPGMGKIFLFFTSPRPVPGLIQPPIQWVPGALSPGV
jgi:hypothetical protein